MPLVYLLIGIVFGSFGTFFTLAFIQMASLSDKVKDSPNQN